MINIKKILIRLGNTIACLLMLSPLFILHNYKSFDVIQFVIIFLCSILYDVYMYHVIILENKIEDFNNEFHNLKKIYHNFTYPNGEKATDKEKYDSIITYIDNRFDDLKKY